MMEYHHHQPSCLSMYQTRDGDDKVRAASSDAPRASGCQACCGSQSRGAKARGATDGKGVKARGKGERESRIWWQDGGGVASSSHKDAGANIGVALAPHTLGRTAALATTPKPSVKLLMPGVASSGDDTSSLPASPASSRPRQQPPPVPTDSKSPSSATSFKSIAESIFRGTL